MKVFGFLLLMAICAPVSAERELISLTVSDNGDEHFLVRDSIVQNSINSNQRFAWFVVNFKRPFLLKNGSKVKSSLSQGYYDCKNQTSITLRGGRLF